MNTATAVNPCDPIDEQTAAGVAPKRVITITEDAKNDFTVREGDRYVDRLTTDEAMVQTIKLLSSGFPGFRMMTHEEHEQLAQSLRARLAARSAD